MSSRKGDIAMVVCQDNAAKTLTIESIDETNAMLEPIIGYEAKEILNQSLRDYLPPQINENIDDYLEFEEGGNDLGSVLSKSRGFGLLNKAGNITKFDMRIQRDVSMDEKDRFLLIMRGHDAVTSQVYRTLEDFKEYEVLDPLTDLPTSESFAKKAKIVHAALRAEEIAASMVVLHIDDFEQITQDYGTPTSEGLIKEVAFRCTQTFRDADVIGYAGDGKFGVILLDAGMTNALIPLNRLRNLIANQPLYIPGNEHVAGTISIACTEMTPDDTVDAIISRCEDALLDNDGESNYVIEVK